MRAGSHIMTSAALGATIYGLGGPVSMALAAVAAGVLTDLDHVLDYYMERGIPLKLSEFFAHYYERRHKRIVLALHGWEWLLALPLIAWLTGWQPVITGMAIGYAFHFIPDLLSNGLKMRAYSFFWRMSRGFNPQDCFPAGFIEKPKEQ